VASRSMDTAVTRLTGLLALLLLAAVPLIATPQISSRGPAWSGQRLRDWFTAFFEDESVVVLSHPEPFRHDHGPDGEIVIRRPASGLVTGLEPLIQGLLGRGGGARSRYCRSRGRRSAGRTGYATRQSSLPAPTRVA
jgi:hypothetical protein